MSNFLGGFPTYTQLPAIDQVSVFTGDSAYTVDDGSYWIATQPSAPPGALAQWYYIDTLRGAPGPQGEAGVGLSGPQGQIGPKGAIGSPGPQGPPGKNSFSYLSHMFSVPATGAAPLEVTTTDTSWMTPGLLLYIPGAGTFTVVGSPVDPYNVNLVNSGDPNNAAPGTIITAGNVVSPANQRGPMGPAGAPGPQGPAGPQGVGGASAYTTLVQAFTIPAAEGVAFVLDASSFAVGLIVYVASGNPNGVYCSVAAVNPTANTLTLQNQGYPGGDPVGSVAPVGATISGTGPQGPQGIQGPAGPAGVQGPTGLAPTGTITMFGGPTAPGGWLNCDGSSQSRIQYPALFSVIQTIYGTGTGGASTFSLPNLQGRFPLGYQSGTYAMGALGGEATHTLVTAEMPVHNHTASATSSATQGNHTHTDSGHVHGADHYHNIGAGQFNHNHPDGGHAHNFPSNINASSVSVGSGAQGPWPFLFTPGAGSAWMGNTLTAGANIQPATLPAGGTAYASQTGTGNTLTNYAAISTVPAGAITVSTSVSVANTGGGGAHNNIPPYIVVQYIIKT